MSRETLKSQMLSLLAPVASRRGSVAVGWWGEVGIGKSHLVREVLRGLSCRMLSVQANIVFSRLLELLGKPGQSTPSAPKQQAQTLLRVLWENAPLMLHLEDFQELLPEQLELWGFVAADLQEGRGVGLLTTGRRVPLPGIQAQRLQPLSDDEQRQVLSEVAGSALPEAAVAWLLERAQGNPLFALEYFRWLSRQGALWNDGQQWRWRVPGEEGVPPSLEGLVSQVLRQPLSIPLQQEVLAARALLPASVETGLWAEVAGLEYRQLEAICSELEAQSLLRGLDFSHPLFAQVIQNSLPISQKRVLAVRAVPRLLNADAPEAILLGALLASLADYSPNQAFEQLSLAAKRLQRLDRRVEAAQVLAKASDYVFGLERGRVALQAAEGLRQSDLAEALRLARMAYQDNPGPETLLLLAELLVLNGQPGAAESAVARLSQRELETQWIPRLIGLRVQQTAFAEALELWKSHPQIHAAAPALTRRDVAWAMMQFGELEYAQTLLQAALGGELSGHERALLLGAQAYLEILKGRPMIAVQSASAAIALLGSDTPRDLARAFEFRAMAREHLGRFAEAATDSEQALRLRGQLGDRWGVAQAQMSLATVLIELAQYERAEELLMGSQSLYARAEAKEPLIVCYCQLAYLYLEWPASHSATLALKHAQTAVQLAQEGASPVNLNLALAHLAWAEARFGDPQQALQYAQQATQVAADMGQPESVALETFARAVALEAQGQKEVALEAYTQAVQMLMQSGVANAERFALEIDRLQGDEASAIRRLGRFVQQGHVHAACLARRYFSLPEELQKTPTALELRVLGPVRILREGQPVRLHSSQSRAFLAHLLEARLTRREEVSDLELFDLFWPHLPENKAKVAAKQLVYRLRAVLGPGAVVRTPRGYALGEMISDAEQFLQTQNPDLWRGPYLEDVQDLTDLEEAPDSPSSDTRAMLYYSLQLKAQTLLDNDPKAALRLGRILMQADPYNRSALLLTCRALHKLGNRRDLAKVYAQARERLLEVGESLPDHWQGLLKSS